MNFSRRLILPFAALAATVVSLAGCVPIDRTVRPTLDQVRSGNARGQVAEDATVRPGEIAGEVDRIDRGRREVYVVADDGRRQVLPFDINRTRVIYHGREYFIDNLEAGDRIAFRSFPRDVAYVDTVRILEPVQARSTSSIARAAPRPRVDVVEGTVESIDHNLGVFEVRPRSGRTVTVSVPYNARPADVDSFRSLRRGDQVRVEGEFIKPESLHLLAFVATR